MQAAEVVSAKNNWTLVVTTVSSVKIINIDPNLLGYDPEQARKDIYENFVREVRLVRRLSHSASAKSGW